MHRLLSLSLSEGSRTAYQRAVDAFQYLNMSWPATTKDIMVFVAHLSLNGRAASTVSLHIAALSYLHKMHNWGDLTVHFLIKKIQEGCRRQRQSRDARLPITWGILEQLTVKLDSSCASQYETVLFRAAFLLAFFGLLRVGEFTAAGKCADITRVISVGDVQVTRGE